jgi:hypothetical protein
MALVYGRAGRLTAKNGGFRPRRAVVDIFQTLASLAGITPNVTDSLEGFDFSPVRWV